MLCAEHVLICQCQTCYNCHIWRQYNRAERIHDLYSFSMHERGKIHLIFWMISKRLLHFLQISLIWSVHDILLLNRCLWTVTSLIAVFFFDIMADTLDVQIFFSRNNEKFCFWCIKCNNPLLWLLIQSVLLWPLIQSV
jgi:hypothetical protein